MTQFTPIRAKMLEYIRQSTESRGFPPSFREIGLHVNRTSTATIHRHLQALVGLGYLERGFGKTRTLHVLHPDLKKDIRDLSTADLADRIKALEAQLADLNFMKSIKEVHA